MNKIYIIYIYEKVFIEFHLVLQGSFVFELIFAWIGSVIN